MNTVEVGTVVYLPPEQVFEFLVDFPRYSKYSKYLASVERDGDGGPGTEYRLRFSWWKLGYTAHTRVTDVDPPERLEWEVTKDLHARGRWEVEAAPEAVRSGTGSSPANVEAESPPADAEPGSSPAGAEAASRVRLVVTYDSGSASPAILDLPLFVSFDWVVGRVVNLVVEEGERVVERIVADLEGERRPVELTVERREE